MSGSTKFQNKGGASYDPTATADLSPVSGSEDDETASGSMKAKKEKESKESKESKKKRTNEQKKKKK